MLLGLDIGTSATKAALCHGDGSMAGVGSAEHPISLPRPGWSEQEPAHWWSSAQAAMRAAASAAGRSLREVRAVGLSGQMHGLVLLDAAAAASGGVDGRALRPAILWNDQRAARECAEIEEAAGGREALVRLSGNAALPGFTLPKILWVRRYEPGLFARVAAWMMPKDFVRWRLTGAVATDAGDAAGTLLLDVDRRAWSDRLFAAVGLPIAAAPPIHESGAAAGGVSAWAAQATGLPEGIPVVAGSGDNMMGAIGAGVVREGVALATIGTSGVIYAHAARPRKDVPAGRTHTMCAADGAAASPGGWCVTGCTLSAGGALRWARDVLAPGTPYDALMAEAASVPAGCEGLAFLPHLTGERCPHPDPLARGGWIGLTARHTRAHLLRAVVEGVAFTMGRILTILRETGVPVREVRLGGGGARSPLWRQVQADVYGCEVTLPTTEEGPALGAVLLAGVGAGVWESVAAACDAAVGVSERCEPGGEGRRACAAAAAVHGSLYDDLKARFAEMAGGGE